MPRIRLIEDLTSSSILPGTNIVVEFDPASVWYQASSTIAAGWLQSGGRVHYNVFVQPPNLFRSRLERLGLNVDGLERADKLRVYDWYSLTLGGKSTDTHQPHSLKVSELSPAYASWIKSGGLGENAETLRIIDNASSLARFNEEKLYVEFTLTRAFPRSPVWKATLIAPMVRGVHSEYVYKSIEAAADGVVDFRFDESSNPPRNIIRIRSFQDVRFDGRWHNLIVKDNFEVELEK